MPTRQRVRHAEQLKNVPRVLANADARSNLPQHRGLLVDCGFDLRDLRQGNGRGQATRPSSNDGDAQRITSPVPSSHDVLSRDETRVQVVIARAFTDDKALQRMLSSELLVCRHTRLKPRQRLSANDVRYSRKNLYSTIIWVILSALRSSTALKLAGLAVHAREECLTC
jgi:hypothetical protein